MKRSDCRAMPRISPTSKIIALANAPVKEKKPYGGEYKGLYKYYLRAIVTNGMIKVSVFNAEWIKEGSKESQYDVFIDTGECRYISLEKDKDGKGLRWRKAMISNLIWWDYYGYRSTYKKLVWSNIDTDKKIRKALGTKGEAYKAIDIYQSNILQERIKKKEKAQCEEWDEDMKPIKDPPESFGDWILRKAIKDHFIFYRYKKNIKKGLCSRCNTEVDISGMNPKNGKRDVCPRCKSRITFKSAGKIKTLRSGRVYVQMIKPYPGGYVIRYFSAAMYYLRSEYWAPHMDIHEYGRSIHGSSAHKDYVWDNYKNKYHRWIPATSCWYYDDSAVLYPRNITLLPNGDRLKEITRRGYEISISKWSDRMARDSIYEKLINAGFDRLLCELINDYSQVPDCCTQDKELHKALKLDKMRMKRLKAMNGGRRELEWLQDEKEADRIWPDEMIQLFSDAGYSTWSFNFISDHMTYPQIWEYLKKQYKDHGYTWNYTYTCWRDYMDMAKKLKIPLDLERNYKPKDVRIAHNEARDMLQGKDIENEARSIDRKWKKLKKVYPKLSKYEYTGKDYQIIAPKSTGDIVREGMILKHCVHTCDYYFDRISTNESYILFLRKTADPKQPYYTLEVEPSGNIRQKRTTGDRQNDDFKDAKEFLARWQRAIQKKLSKEDKALGKKSNDLRLKELKELRKNGNRVWHGVLQGKLLADVLEADFMPVMQEAQ